MTEPTTHFGFRDVAEEDKAVMVRGVFDSVADKYDLMNDLMSMGAHRLWKQFAAQQSGVREGSDVLDVASGSGDLAALLAARVGQRGTTTLSDINASMLERGRRRMVDRGAAGNAYYVQSDAEALPFARNSFDCICIGFGLRNVTRPQSALSSMFGCLRPGGKVLVLEFSKPASKLVSTVYDAYSFNLLPRLGKLVANDADSYQYLVESIRKHPAQEELKAMMRRAGFERVDYHNLAGGIVAVHTGFKF